MRRSQRMLQNSFATAARGLFCRAACSLPLPPPFLAAWGFAGFAPRLRVLRGTRWATAGLTPPCGRRRRRSAAQRSARRARGVHCSASRSLAAPQYTLALPRYAPPRPALPQPFALRGLRGLRAVAGPEELGQSSGLGGLRGLQPVPREGLCWALLGSALRRRLPRSATTASSEPGEPSPAEPQGGLHPQPSARPYQGARPSFAKSSGLRLKLTKSVWNTIHKIKNVRIPFSFSFPFFWKESFNFFYGN